MPLADEGDVENVSRCRVTIRVEAYGEVISKTRSECLLGKSLPYMFNHGYIKGRTQSAVSQSLRSGQRVYRVKEELAVM